MSTLEIVRNQKGGEVALHKGYEYTKNGKSTETQYWRCTQYSMTRCPGRMNSVGINVKKVLDHSHAPDVRKGNVRKVLENIRNRALSTTEPPRKILRNITCSIGRVSSVELPSNINMTRGIRRIRNKTGVHPKNPKTLAELVIDGDNALTLKGDLFVLYDNQSDTKRIVIFSTNTNLSFLSYCDEWYMDGTFDVVPTIFKQLYTIHGRRNKTYVPCVYVLASGKDFFTYAEIFRKLKELQPRLKPKTVMVDFEQAAMKAIQQTFPGVEVYGCFFHMCQCIYRHIQAQGLQSIYGEDENFAQYMRCLAALAFVPPEEVVKRYEELKGLDFFKAKLSGKSAVDVGVQNLLSYFEKTWIGHFARNRFVEPLFSIDLWNVYHQTLAFFPRTNNAVEAWHNAITILFI
ncbi:uncharacterized protein LOC119083925 [Bradysia coprophila]|uniref:uncharacterized protein LOC119083925 n=1 Tax=Bradysia coprophila TaxID=38358 RepID=UPI00187DB57C|nr:uncharacterized protein LOC119083925 [Bradysia coprophila]